MPLPPIIPIKFVLIFSLNVIKTGRSEIFLFSIFDCSIAKDLEESKKEKKKYKLKYFSLTKNILYLKSFTR